MKVIPNDATGFWEIHDVCGFLCKLESEVNAERLALCWNNHDSLVTALQEARLALKELAAHHSGIFSDDAPEFNKGGIGYEAIKTASKALREAGEVGNQQNDKEARLDNAIRALIDDFRDWDNFKDGDQLDTLRKSVNIVAALLPKAE